MPGEGALTATPPVAPERPIRARHVHLAATPAPRHRLPDRVLFVVKTVGRAACPAPRILAGARRRQVGPARVRGAGAGGAAPGPRLRSGWFGACQEQAEPSP